MARFCRHQPPPSSWRSYRNPSGAQIAADRLSTDMYCLFDAPQGPTKPAHAITCCFLSSLKTLLTLTQGMPCDGFNVCDRLIGRFSGDHVWQGLGVHRSTKSHCGGVCSRLHPLQIRSIENCTTCRRGGLDLPVDSGLPLNEYPLFFDALQAPFQKIDLQCLLADFSLQPVTDSRLLFSHPNREHVFS